MIFQINISVELGGLVTAILGGVVGAVGSLIIQILIQRYNRIIQVNRVRRTLIYELESMKPLDSFETEDHNIPGGNWFHSEVFHSVSTDLGLLSQPEATAVTAFYSNGKYASDYAQRLTEQATQTYEQIDVLHSNINSIQRHRRAALHLLNENQKVSRSDIIYLLLGLDDR